MSKATQAVDALLSKASKKKGKGKKGRKINRTKNHPAFQRYKAAHPLVGGPRRPKRKGSVRYPPPPPCPVCNFKHSADLYCAPMRRPRG